MAAPALGAIASKGVGATTATTGSTVGSAAGASKAANVVGAVGGTASTIGEALSPVNTISSVIGARRARRTQKRQFDATFRALEKWRGLQYALNDYATRKGLSLQEVQQQHQQQMDLRSLDIQEEQSASTLEMDSLNRRQSEEQMRWKREDRSNSQKLGKAYSRGILAGMMGG